MIIYNSRATLHHNNDIFIQSRRYSGDYVLLIKTESTIKYGDLFPGQIMHTSSSPKFQTISTLPKSIKVNRIKYLQTGKLLDNLIKRHIIIYDTTNLAQYRLKHIPNQQPTLTLNFLNMYMKMNYFKVTSDENKNFLIGYPIIKK